MGGRVAAGRVVAAADVPARLAHPQVDPAAAGREALLTAGDAVGDVEELDRVEVRAGGHGPMVAVRQAASERLGATPQAACTRPRSSAPARPGGSSARRATAPRGR